MADANTEPGRPLHGDLQGSQATPTDDTAAQPRIRVSPYPQRRRTPLRSPEQVLVRAPRQRVLALASQSPLQLAQSPLLPANPPLQLAQLPPQQQQDPEGEFLFEVRLQPIVKKTVNERESSGDELDVVTARGSTFDAILQCVWQHVSSHISAVAAKENNEWVRRDPTIEDWTSVLAFKSKTHRVPATRQASSWQAWFVRVRNDVDPITLIVYKYGQAIRTTKKLKEYEAKFHPAHPTDRAGAAAEEVIIDVIDQLRTRWRATLRGSHVAWRLWASDITGNHERANWPPLIEAQPPPHLVGYFSATDSRVLARNAEIRRSARVAQETVTAALGDYRVLRSDMDGVMRRLDDIERNLLSRQRVLDGFIEDLAPPSPSQVEDPLNGLENLEDIEHQ